MNIGNWFRNTFLAERYVDGSVFYRIGHQKHSIDGYDNLKACLQNPVLFGLVDKIACYLAQTNFYVGEQDNPNTADRLIQLLENPNEYQSKQDFIREYIFQRIANGYVFIAPIGATGFENRADRVDSLYNLTSTYVKYSNEKFQIKLLTRQQIQDKGFKFRYEDGNGVSKSFLLSQVIPFFDVANGLCEDFLLRSPSKIDSVLLPAVNMIKAFEAQNVVIKSNGREMFFSEKQSSNLGISQPIGQDDKNEIQRKNKSYGTQIGQSRSMFLRNETGWKSLHIDAKDLALQEAIETTASAMAAAFNVPKDLIPVFGNAKYENKKEAEIALIQSVIEPIAADFCNSLNSFFVGYDRTPLKYSVDHLAPMEHIEAVKINKALNLSVAYRNFTQAGMTPEQTNLMFNSLGINFESDEQ